MPVRWRRSADGQWRVSGSAWRDMSRREAVGAAAFLALPVIEGKARGPLTGILEVPLRVPVKLSRQDIWPPNTP